MRSPSRPSMAGAASGRGSPSTFRGTRRAARRTGEAGRASPRPSVAADEADQAALHLDPVGTEDARLVSLVSRLQGDRGAASTQPLQGRLDIVDQGDDDGAVIGGVAALDDDGVAVEDAGILHAVAGDFERVMLAAVEQACPDARRRVIVA